MSAHDQIVSITLTNVSLKDGKTLYKGRADISVAVFDVAQGGSVVYRKNFVEYEFPSWMDLRWSIRRKPNFASCS